MQLSRTEILEQLKEILLSADRHNREQIDRYDESSRLMGELGLTSVSMLYLVIAIEETFDIRFDNVGVADFATLGDVVSYIAAKLQ